MEVHHIPGERRETEPGGADAAPGAAHALTILQRYSAGDISAREAARELGPRATEHDVFAGILAAGLRLPMPPPEQVEREIAALSALYGPHGPRLARN